MLLNFRANLINPPPCQGGHYGQAAAARRTLGTDQTALAAGTTQAQRWPAAGSRSRGAYRNSFRAKDRLSVGIPSARVRLWIGHDVLAATSRLASGRCLEADVETSAGRIRAGGPNRLVYVSDRQLLRTSNFWGAKTGPNPTDRGKNGSKRHLIVDGQGTPLAIAHTGANCHDSEMAVPLVDEIPPIKQPRGRPRKRPDELLGDRAYDAEAKIREPLRKRGIRPLIARRNTEHGSGLGKYRYVVEACFDWLFNWRRLRVRYEKRPDIHDAFLFIGCAMICWNRVLEYC